MRVVVLVSRVLFVVLVSMPLAAALAPDVRAQETPKQEYGESIEVRLHNLDAVVTDREGRPVPGLTKEDFVLLENGVAQEITNFSAYDERSSKMTIVGGTDAAPTPAPVAEAAAVAPAPPRHFVFFIDEMAIQGMARKKLKENALTLVRSMRPGDVATVVRPTGTAKIELPYTSDVKAIEHGLSKAIDSCRITMTSPAFRELQMFRRAIEQAVTANEFMTAKREYVQRAKDRVEQRLNQLRALVTTMSGGEGKKVLVMITSGLSSRPGQEAYSLDEQIGISENVYKRRTPEEQERQRLLDESPSGQVDGITPKGGRLSGLRQDALERDQPDAQIWAGMERARGGDVMSQVDSIARSAAAEGVTIYALEPEVPLFLDANRSADARVSGSTLVDGAHLGARYTIPPEMIGQLLHHSGQTLTSMTEKTGGRWFRGIGSIDETFRQVNDDLQVYYSLAYRAAGNDSKPGKLKLAVRNRPDLQVRTRSETIDPKAKSRGMADRVVAELVYPGDLNDLQMEVKTEKPQRDGRMFIVPVEVVIPVEKITFVRSQSGVYTGKVSLHYATALDQKEFVSYGRQEQIIELSAKQYAQLKKIRYRYTSSITVPKGNIRIALGVTDTTSSMSSLRTVAVKAQ
jgi:VWFA-related protein